MVDINSFLMALLGRRIFCQMQLATSVNDYFCFVSLLPPLSIFLSNYTGLCLLRNYFMSELRIHVGLLLFLVEVLTRTIDEFSSSHLICRGSSSW